MKIVNLRKGIKTMTKHKEIIICSAIQTKLGRVIKGHRHHDCIRTASRIPSISHDDIINRVEGFITSQNRFVGREEAHLIHLGLDGILFSEDIY